MQNRRASQSSLLLSNDNDDDNDNDVGYELYHSEMYLSCAITLFHSKKSANMLVDSAEFEQHLFSYAVHLARDWTVFPSEEFMQMYNAVFLHCDSSTSLEDKNIADRIRSIVKTMSSSFLSTVRERIVENVASDHDSQSLIFVVEGVVQRYQALIKMTTKMFSYAYQRRVFSSTFIRTIMEDSFRVELYPLLEMPLLERSTSILHDFLTLAASHCVPWQRPLDSLLAFSSLAEVNAFVNEKLLPRLLSMFVEHTRRLTEKHLHEKIENVRTYLSALQSLVTLTSTLVGTSTVCKELAPIILRTIVHEGLSPVLDQVVENGLWSLWGENRYDEAQDCVSLFADLIQKHDSTLSTKARLLFPLFERSVKRVVANFLENAMTCSTLKTSPLDYTEYCIATCHCALDQVLGCFDALRSQEAARRGSVQQTLYEDVRESIYMFLGKLAEKSTETSTGKKSFAESLAMYTEHHFSVALRTMAEESSGRHHDSLSGIVDILQFCSSKDEYVEFYRNALARRLLGKGDTSSELDEWFIGRLRDRFSPSLVQKLASMMNDLRISLTLRDEYNQRAVSCGEKSVKFVPTVLTFGCWPTFRQDLATAVLPQPVDNHRKLFTTWYRAKYYDSRKLIWIPSLGKVQLQFWLSLSGGSKNWRELFVCESMAYVLLMFNDRAQWSITELCRAICPPNPVAGDVELVKKAVYSLVHGKVPILRNTENDTLEVVSAISEKSYRITVPMLAHAGSAVSTRDDAASADSAAVSREVQESRNYAIDAAIVRLMKTRKTCFLNDIVADCIRMLSSNFVPDVKHLKKRIDHLIHLDYLSRDPDNVSLFHYVA